MGLMQLLAKRLETVGPVRVGLIGAANSALCSWRRSRRRQV